MDNLTNKILKDLITEKKWIKVHKYFNMKVTDINSFRWDYSRKKKGQYSQAWSEKFNTFEKCLEDLEDFYKRLSSVKDEQRIIIGQIVKVKLLEKINPENTRKLRWS